MFLESNLNVVRVPIDSPPDRNPTMKFRCYKKTMLKTDATKEWHAASWDPRTRKRVRGAPQHVSVGST